MQIAFVLPGPPQGFSGGFNVMYEHANRLAQKGHSITLVHTPFRRANDGFARTAAKDIEFLLGAWDARRSNPRRHFDFDPSVRHVWARSPTHATFDSADFVILSFSTTAEIVRSHPPIRARWIYLVQEYEYFMTAGTALKARMRENFGFGMLHFAISPAAEMMVKECGGTVHARVPNGIADQWFRTTIDIDDPRRDGIGFPTRNEPFKATRDAIRALEQVRARFLAETGKDLRVWSFGGKRPDYMPAWVEYHARPSESELHTLYSRSMVFVTPSLFEGWGLPGCEAMACGAALVSSDNGGVRAYATHGETALIVPAGDTDALAASVLDLCLGRESRVALAVAGQSHVQRFSWDNASAALEDALRMSRTRGIECNLDKASA